MHETEPRLAQRERTVVRRRADDLERVHAGLAHELQLAHVREAGGRPLEVVVGAVRDATAATVEFRDQLAPELECMSPVVLVVRIPVVMVRRVMHRARQVPLEQRLVRVFLVPRQ